MDKVTRRRKSRSPPGNRLIQKQKDASRWSSDSRCYIDGIDKDDQFILELEQRSAIRASGMPMKKLLAEEMSKEVEPRKRPPGVIARLMGLEGLPYPRHHYKQEKRSLDQRRDASVDVQLSSQIHDSRFNRRSSMDQQEFKDVYEDLEASHVIDRRCSSRWSARSILTKPDMALVPRNSRSSMDKTRQGSAELDDALEMLGCNKDLLLKFLEQPDPSVQKRSNSQADSNSSYGSRIAVLTPFNSAKYESNAKAWRSGRYASSTLDAPSYLKREDGLLLEVDNRYSAHQSRNSSTFQLDESNEELENTLPTRIVVLKPNLGKMRSAGASCLLADQSHGCQTNGRRIRDYPTGGSAGKVSKKYSSNGMPGPKGGRDIVGQISPRMREGWEEIADASVTTFRGYIGDESSYEANGSESESDNDFYRCQSSSYGESSLSKEAKMRLSERWRMTHRYQDLEMVSKGCTLAEMLALPDRGERLTHVTARSGLSRERTRFGSSTRAAAEVGPLGISYKNCWEDETDRNLFRSRSLRPPPDGLSYQSYKYRVQLAEDKHLLRCGRNKVVKGNLSSKEDISSKDSKSRGKKSHFCHALIADEIDSSSERNFEIQMDENNTDLSLVFGSSAKEATCRSPIVENNTDLSPESRSISLTSTSLELLEKRSSFHVVGHQSTPGIKDPRLQERCQEQPDQGSNSLQSPRGELDSYESFKEVDHPSPVSVLETTPCSEEASSSESFERVNAELHELRKQLRLLKLESGTLFPIEEDMMQLSPTVSEGKCAVDVDGWQISYALDLLMGFGLEELDFSICGAMCLDPEIGSPLDPKLFDNLEKKYSDESMGSRPERKLVFDRINSALLEIFRTNIDSYPWVMPTLCVPISKLDKALVRNTIEKLMIQDFSNWEITESELDGEMHWSNPKVEIDVIGREIEKLLIDDLILDGLFDIY